MWHTLLLWWGMYMPFTNGIALTREQCILGKWIFLCIYQQWHILQPSSLNRTVPSKIWSCLHPTVSQGPLVDRFLLLPIISALFSPLKTLQIGFHFCVSLLHLTTILTLGSFSKETQCEKRLNISFAFFDSVIDIRFHNTLLINVSPLTYLVNQSLVHPSKVLLCQLQCQLMFIFKEVPFTHQMTSTSLFPR